MTPTWQTTDGSIKLYLGDSLDVVRSLPANSIDAVITSPPYNLGASPWPHLGNWKPGDSAGGQSKGNYPFGSSRLMTILENLTGF
jgi:DNA modification methylase